MHSSIGHIIRQGLSVPRPKKGLLQSYGLPTTIIASEDRPAIVKRGDHRRGVVCFAGDDRR